VPHATPANAVTGLAAIARAAMKIAVVIERVARLAMMGTSQVARVADCGVPVPNMGGR